MKIPVNPEAEAKLPPSQPDSSGIGVHYIDAMIKPLNLELEDGRKVSCKRKGLKILLAVGDAKGEAIIDRIANGPDPKDMFRVALEAAATEAGMRISIADGNLQLEDA